MKKIYRFTLVEILAVMALIAILSAIGFGVYSYAKAKAKQSSTEALLKQVEAGLSAFNTKNGYYPKSGTDFSVIKFDFNDDGTVNWIDFGDERLKWNKPSQNQQGQEQPLAKDKRMENERLEAFTKAVDMEVIKNHLNGNNEIVDAWGNKIYYRSPGEFKKGAYDLVSAGADGSFGKDKADTPTGITDLNKFRETSGDRLCDDVFTF